MFINFKLIIFSVCFMASIGSRFSDDVVEMTLNVSAQIPLHLLVRDEEHLRALNEVEAHLRGIDATLCGAGSTDCDNRLWIRSFRGNPAREQLRDLLVRYVRLHAEILSHARRGESESIPGGAQQRYVIVSFDERSGLGNRMQSLVSAFLFALLSDRVLLVDWPDVQPMEHWNGEETVAMPELSLLFDSPSFRWRLAEHEYATRPFDSKCANRTEYARGDQFWFICCDSKQRQCVTHTYYRGIESHFQCATFGDITSSVSTDTSAFSSTPYIFIRTWDYFAPALLLNPFYSTTLRTLLRHGGVVSSLAPFLFRPVASVRTRVAELLRLYSHTSFYRIGLQIRRVGINKLGAEQERITLQCVDDALDRAPRHNGIAPVVVLATDTESTRRRVVEYVGERAHVLFNDAPISRAALNGVRNGLVDMYLLSKVDVLITSAASTFGSVARAIGNVEGYSVGSDSICMSLRSNQPCFFQFSPHSCVDMSVIDEDVREQIQQCHFK